MMLQKKLIFRQENTFKGSYAELEKPYDWLFGEWLPESGYRGHELTTLLLHNVSINRIQETKHE